MAERRRVAESKAAGERTRSDAERQRDSGRMEELKREEAVRAAAAQADSDTERRQVADQQALGRTEREARELVNADRECDAFSAESNDELDDWADDSSVLRSPVMRPREERSGEKRRRRRNHL